MSADNGENNFALVPKAPVALEKAEPGTKRVLTGMVADVLTLAKKGTPQKTRPLRIVMVNDEPGVLKSFEIIIQRWFKDVVLLCFDNSAAAYEELMRTNPDLLITDDTMPGMSGQELCRRLFDSHVAYPIIVDSAWEPTEQWVREFANRGLNISFLRVPCDIESILKAVEAALKTPRNMEASHPVSVRFSAEHIISNLTAHERFAAIREIVAYLINIGQIKPRDEQVVLDAIFKRENSMSTGIGFGIAIPRGRVNCVKDIILAIGVSASGVEFGALDNQPVNVIVLSIVPANSLPHETELMKSDSAFLRFLHNADNLGQLRRSNSVQETWSILKPVLDEALASGIWREFDLKWRLGARTAALIVKLANQFVSHVKISSGDEVANAKSIMGVMMVGGEVAKTGGRIKVSANGIDMVAALDAMQELFTCGARVDHCIKPDCPAKPCLVSYTKDVVTYGCDNELDGHIWNVPRKDEP